MILLEQYIELKICQFNNFKKYDVLEIGNDEGVYFIVFYKGYYVFTMVPRKDDVMRFQLSEFDKNQHLSVDWDLYSKIETSLYSVFIEEMPS